jgi:K+-sensing histidine kinase KdpD
MSLRTFARSGELDPRVGVVLGGLAAVVLPALLVPVRDDLYAPALALLLVLPVLLGAVTGGRVGGVVTAVVATMGYDFFLTRPYLSLTIDSRDDVETAVVFLLVALVVGTVAAGARRSFVKAELGRLELEGVHRVAEAAAGPGDTGALIELARRELVRVLALDACEFDVDTSGSSLPVLEHTGTLNTVQHHFVHGGFTLPSGVELRVVAKGRDLGRFILHGRPDVPVSHDARLAAVVIADHVASALTYEGCSKRREQA